MTRAIVGRVAEPDDDQERRSGDRLDVPADLHGEIMVFQPMRVRELSRTGAQIEVAVPLHVDSLHELRLTLGLRSVVVRGRVVHCRIRQVDHEQVVYSAGLQFIEPSAHVEAVIASFVSSMQEPRVD